MLVEGLDTVAERSGRSGGHAGDPAGHQGRTRLRDRRGLLVLCVGLPLVEASILLLIGPPGSAVLAPHVSAAAPFGTFHDLRWLLVYNQSWLAFGFELALLIGFRTAVTTGLVRLAWPEGVERPSLATTVHYAAAFTAVSAVVLSPFAVLLVGMSVVSISWPFFVAVPAVTIIALFAHHGPIRTPWWRTAPALKTVGWVALTFAVLTLAGTIATVGSQLLVLPAVAVAGLFNAWAWSAMVHSLTGERRPARRFMPVAPAGIVSLVATIFIGASIGFAVTERTADAAEPRPWEPSERTPVLVVAGFGSSFDPGEVDAAQIHGEMGFRFSYAGLDGGGRPLPYEDRDTYKPLPDLVGLLESQVEHVHRSTGQRVAIVAESEGALIAKLYLMSRSDAPVDDLVMASPIVEPGRVYFPSSGQEGWGVAAGWQLQGIGALLDRLSSLDLTPDNPLVRSILDLAPVLRPSVMCPLADTAQLVLYPLADSVAAPAIEDGAGGVEVVVVPAFHGGLLNDPAVQRAITAHLDRGTLPEEGLWGLAGRLLQAGSATWQVPELPLSLNGDWGAPTDEIGCPEIQAHLTDLFTDR